jgi:cobalt-zinc-cadmium efflux system outer membrane protein
VALKHCFPRAAAGPRARWIALSILCVGLPGAGWADGLKLIDAAGGSVGSAPDLQAATAGAQAARATAEGAALAPPWETTFTLENFAGGGAASGVDAAEGTIEFGRVVEARAKREQRMRASESAVGAADAATAVVRSERIAKVCEQYLDTWVSQERARILIDVVEIGRDGLAAAQRRVESGRSSEAELASTRSLAAQTELEARLASSQRDAGLAALRVLLGSSAPPAIVAIDWNGSVRDLEPLLPPFPAGAARAEAERKQAAAALAYAQTQRSADWHLAAGVRRLEDIDTEALVFSVSRPLGTSKRAQPVIDEAAANLRRAEALGAAAAQDLQLQRDQLRSEAELHRLELTTLEQSVIPQAERARDVYRRGYQLGRFSFIEISSAERDLLNSRTRVIDARAALASAELRYRILTGQWPEDASNDP